MRNNNGGLISCCFSCVCERERVSVCPFVLPFHTHPVGLQWPAWCYQDTGLGLSTWRFQCPQWTGSPESTSQSLDHWSGTYEPQHTPIFVCLAVTLGLKVVTNLGSNSQYQCFMLTKHWKAQTLERRSPSRSQRWQGSSWSGPRTSWCPHLRKRAHCPAAHP